MDNIRKTSECKTGNSYEVNRTHNSNNNNNNNNKRD